MTRPRDKRIGQILSDPSRAAGRAAARLVAHAHRIEALDRAVRGVLEPGLAGHCRVLDFDDDTLVLGVDSPVWATRLRYHTPALPDAIASKTGQRFKRVETRVSPPGGRRVPAAPPRPAPDMSAEAARTIESVAATIEDPELASALRRLARNAS